MNEACIVCGAPATRVANLRDGSATAFVCGAPHARSWQRSMKKPMAPVSVRKGRAAPSEDARREAEQGQQRRAEDGRQLTFLGGKPVK